MHVFYCKFKFFFHSSPCYKLFISPETGEPHLTVLIEIIDGLVTQLFWKKAQGLIRNWRRLRKEK